MNCYFVVQLVNDLQNLQEQSLLWGCRHKAQGIACRQVVGKCEPVTHEVFLQSCTPYIQYKVVSKHRLCLYYLVGLVLIKIFNGLISED